jgi:hypothetical protein
LVGILAPQLNDIGAASGGVGATVDTSVGDLFSNIGGIISMAGRGGTSASPATQQDRDNAAIADNVKEALRIEGLHSSGAMGGNQRDALIRINFLDAVAAVPSDTTNIATTLSAIHGKDINVPESDLEAEHDTVVAKFYSEDPRGIALYPSTVVPDENGDIDLVKSKRKADLVFQDFANQDAKDQVLSDELARLKLSGDITQEKQKLAIEPFILDNTVRAIATVNGLGTIFDMSVETPDVDVSTMLAGLIAEKNKFAQSLAVRAAAIGIADNPNLYNPKPILEAFEGPIRFLTFLQTQPGVLDKAQQSRASLRVGQLITEVGGAATPRGIEFASEHINANKSAEIVDASFEWLKMTPKKSTLSHSTEALPKGANEPSTISPTFSEQAARLPEFEQIEHVKFNLEGFYLSEGYEGNDPGVRAEGVELFTRAVGIMQATGKDITETTFSQTYRPQFIELFTEMTAVDDDLSTKFKNVVSEHLSTVLSQQNVTKDFLVSNNFSDYKDLKIKFNGEKYVLDLGTSKGQGLGLDTKEVVMKNLLKKHGLPVSIEGLTSLIRIPASQIGLGAGNPQEIAAIGDARRMVRILKPQQEFLNKVLGVGEALNQVISPTIPDFAEEEEPIHVTNAEDMAKVAIGGTFTYIDTITGKLVKSTFGG